MGGSNPLILGNPALPDPVAVTNPLANPFGVDYQVRLVGQTAHPYGQALGFAVADGSGPGGSGGTPLTVDQMIALLDTHPPAAGTPAVLQVRGVLFTGNALRVRFNHAIDARALASGDVAARIVVLRDNQPVKGRLVADPDGEGFAFVAEQALLPEGSYTVLLKSGRGGIARADGDALDGDFDGRAGGDYKARFNLVNPAQRNALAPTLQLVASMDWLSESWADQAWAPAPAAGTALPLWAGLTGGIGGLATLAAAPLLGHNRLARRAAAAGRRRAASADEPPRVNRQAAAADTTVLPAPAQADWLAVPDPVNANAWRIQL